MSNYEYWLDLKEYLTNAMYIDEYVLFYFYALTDRGTKKVKFSCVRFWSYTIIFLGIGKKIIMNDGHVLTVQDCFNEIEDLLKERKKDVKTN